MSTWHRCQQKALLSTYYWTLDPSPQFCFLGLGLQGLAQICLTCFTGRHPLPSFFVSSQHELTPIQQTQSCNAIPSPLAGIRAAEMGAQSSALPGWRPSGK